YVIVVHEDHFIPVPWTLVAVDFTDKVVTVDITRERLLEAPSFSGWAEVSKTEWREKVNKHFDGVRRDRRTDVRSDRERGERKDERGRADERRETPKTKNDGKSEAREKDGRDNKAEEKKATSKKPDEKKSDEKKSDEKKPEEKKSDEKKDKPH